MPLWEYIINGNIERDVNERSTYLLANPKESYTLKAERMGRADLDVEIARVLSSTPTVYSYTLSSGSISGIPRNLTYEIRPGTEYYDVTVGLQKEDSSVKWGWVMSGSISRPDVNSKSKTELAKATDPPDETITVTAKNAPYSQVVTQMNAARSGVTTGLFTLLSGNGSATGLIKTVSFNEVEGTNLCDITVTMQVPQTAAIVWEWDGSCSANKNLIIAKSWGGGTRYYVGEDSDVTFSIKARSASLAAGLAEVEKVKAKTTQAETYGSFVGIPVSASVDTQVGSDLCDISLTLRQV